jgi:predicted DCC family thiol-disulfide oxidoreductase YuxK
VILFDGVCNLCNGFVQFVIARDPAERFRFGALQSVGAQRLLASTPHIAPISDSVVLIDEGRLFTRSSAALGIARRLAFPWWVAYVFILVPRPLRDRVYDWVASHRYGWFGRRDVCVVPTPELRARFLDDAIQR